MEFSDYIVFADESGDHGLDSINPEFPVFSLVFSMVRKEIYTDRIEPAVRRFKYKWFGHDAVILHERDIRKQIPPFDVLRGPPSIREEFYDDLNALMAALDAHIFCSVIDKVRHKAKYSNPWNPYEVALHFCMERLCSCMLQEGQQGRLVHILFESRGKSEDKDLELEFRRIASNNAQWGWKRVDFSKVQFEPVFVAKSANVAGHQIADLIARPLALHALRPDQSNRAFEGIRPILRAFKVFP